MTDQYKQKLRWDGGYVSLTSSRKVPTDIIRKAFSEYGVNDAEAEERGLCLFGEKRDSDPVLVFAPSNQGKVPTQGFPTAPQSQGFKPVSQATSENLTPGLKSMTDMKSLQHSDAFLSLLRILSLVVKKGLGQEKTTPSLEYQWLKDMPDDRKIEGIPDTLLKCVGDICCVDTGKYDGLRNIQDLFSKLCACPALGQLKKLFHFHRLETTSLESDTLITVGVCSEWAAIADITIQRPPTFLAVNVRCPDPVAKDSLTLQVSFGGSRPVSVKYRIFGFLSLLDATKISAFKLAGPFYEVYIRGNAVEKQKKQKRCAERTHLESQQVNCSFLIFEILAQAQETVQAVSKKRTHEKATNECQSEPEIPVVTRKVVRYDQIKKVTSHTLHEPARQNVPPILMSPKKAHISETLSQKSIHRIAVTKERLDLLISNSTSSQEHFAIINGFSEAKDSLLKFELNHFRMAQAESTTKPMLSLPKKDFQNTIVHSFSRLSFPELERTCVQHSQYIFVDMLHMDVRSKYGCSHVMTTADLSKSEICATYNNIRTIQEKYETHLIEKGKGVMASLTLYNSNCKDKDFRIQVLQLPKIRDEFRAREFGYSGGQLYFEALSHAHLILGMLSEMAGPDSKVTDGDIPLEFVFKLPVGETSEQRDAIIEHVLNRWTIPTYTDNFHCLNLMVVLYITMMSRMLIW